MSNEKLGNDLINFWQYCYEFCEVCKITKLRRRRFTNAINA